MQGFTEILKAYEKLNEQVCLLKQDLIRNTILAEMGLELNSLDDVEIKINNALSIIGNHTQMSRVYVFENNKDGTAISNVFEWCNTGISTQIHNFQNVPYDSISSLKQYLLKEEIINIDDISKHPHDLIVFMKQRESVTSVFCPILVKSNFYGFIGFDDCIAGRHWSRLYLELFRIVASLISNAYERKYMEESIIMERDKALHANKAKSEFLSNMSHEIRTPLNAIIGFSEALYNKIESEYHKKMVKSIVSSGKFLLSLLNDILDLSKIEAGKLEISPHPTNLNVVFKEIGMLFREKAKKKGLSFTVEETPYLPASLELDEIRIRQVIFNLVGNAVKFTNKGYIQVRTEFDYKFESVGRLTIKVKDTGIGIPHEMLGSIFEAFRQLPNDSNHTASGTGLGLAITKKIVEKMNGTISVNSTPGKGSEFTVTIPDIVTNKVKSKINTTEENYKDIRFKDTVLLVVDDVLPNIEVIAELVSEAGVSILSAENGEIALDILNHNIPNIIFLDLRMPGMSGYELAKIIKTKPEFNNIPLIAYTAFAFEGKRNENSKLFHDFLYKPVSSNALFSLLKRYLKVSNSMSQRKRNTLYTEIDFEDAVTKQHFKEIRTILIEDFLPQWASIKDSLVLFKMEEFALRLKKMSESYNFKYLQNYSGKLLIEIKMVDIEAIQEHIECFPGIIELLTKKIDKKYSSYGK